MFKDKKFRVRDVAEVKEDLAEARRMYGYIEKIFLADGDALCLSMPKLEDIIGYINELFTETKSINIYASPKDVLAKSQQDLERLHALGVKILYIGAESGNDKILKNINKGATRDEIIEAVRKTESSGIKASVTFIQGLGGEAMYREHAIDTGTMISAMEPSFVGLLTLMLDDAAEITADIREGRLKLLSPMQVCEETLLMLENINLTKECIFRSNHASNYVPLAGTLPQDKEKMMKLLVRAMKTEGFKPEGLRML
ncbi:hypothetical protein GCWU000322_00996 [Eubacterium saphenum ATCC 49989]|nr:hypothetical protein GCWU000322_00996 [Eubacterium saphenum ATCC 49989]